MAAILVVVVSLMVSPSAVDVATEVPSPWWMVVVSPVMFQGAPLVTFQVVVVTFQEVVEAPIVDAVLPQQVALVAQCC